MGYGNNQPFEPKPGTGTLFVKVNQKTASAPGYDGYFIAEFPIAAGEKIKLVGWDKSTAKGNMINLKVGREQQDVPHQGYSQGYQQPRQGYGAHTQAQYQQPRQQPTPYQQPIAPHQSGQTTQPQSGYQHGYQNQPNPTYGNPPDRGAPPPAVEPDLPF